MRDIRALLIMVLGVIIFIALLPALLWLFAIILILIANFAIYSRVKYRRMMKDAQEQFKDMYQDDYTNNRQNSNRNIDPDVIDVEYTEKEDDES